MVGLRWWNEVKEDGTNVWRYESKEDRSAIDTVDSYIFWFGLYLFPIVWVLMVTPFFHNKLYRPYSSCFGVGSLNGLLLLDLH